MPPFAPRISPRLLEAIPGLDDPSLPIAEIARRVGAHAERLGHARPSYQRLRVLVHESRRMRRAPGAGSILIDIAMRARPPEAIVDHLASVGVPRRDS